MHVPLLTTAALFTAHPVCLFHFTACVPWATPELAVRVRVLSPLLCALVPSPPQPAAMEPNPLAKKKIWEGVQPVLRTDQNRVAGFKGAALRTAEGPVTAESLAGARIG